MQSCTNFLIVVITMVLVSVGFAQETVTLPARPVSAGDTSAVSVPSFPYIAEIIGDDVYIRSGPGTNYYYCGKLNKTDKVEVVSHQFSWSRIVPPAGSFSWISMQYVSVNPNDPTSAIVSGDGVRVYAGSELLKPIHSTTLQRKLNKGEQVKLLGEEKEGSSSRRISSHKLVGPFTRKN